MQKLIQGRISDSPLPVVWVNVSTSSTFPGPYLIVAQISDLVPDLLLSPAGILFFESNDEIYIHTTPLLCKWLASWETWETCQLIFIPKRITSSIYLFFIRVLNLYCRLSIFLIDSLFSFINKNHLNYTSEDKQPPRSSCSAQLQPRHEMAIEISSYQLSLQHWFAWLLIYLLTAKGFQEDWCWHPIVKLLDLPFPVVNPSKLRITIRAMLIRNLFRCNVIRRRLKSPLFALHKCLTIYIAWWNGPTLQNSHNFKSPCKCRYKTKIILIPFRKSRCPDVFSKCEMLFTNECINLSLQSFYLQKWQICTLYSKNNMVSKSLWEKDLSILLYFWHEFCTKYISTTEK